MTISQLAKSAAVKVETVRYYQRIGLLGTPKRPRHGFRAYSDEDVLHLRFIRQAQKLGFTLEEIRVLLRLSSRDCEKVERLARERLEAVRIKISELLRLETALEATISDCKGRQPAADCPLIEALIGASVDTSPRKTPDRSRAVGRRQARLKR